MSVGRILRAVIDHTALMCLPNSSQITTLSTMDYIRYSYKTIVLFC